MQKTVSSDWQLVIDMLVADERLSYTDHPPLWNMVSNWPKFLLIVTQSDGASMKATVKSLRTSLVSRTEMQDMNEQEAQSFIKRAEDEPGSTLGNHSWLTQSEVHTQEGNGTPLNLI